MTVTDTTATETPTRAEAVQRASDLFPLIRENARRADDERHLPAEVVGAFKDAGLARILVPQRFGGWELDLTTHMEVAIELGRAGGAMGWVGSFLIDHPFLLAHFPEQAQADVWTEGDGPDSLLSTSFVPVGKVKVTDGGYQLSGTWSWASGVGHASWIMLGGLIHAEAGGPPEYRLFLVPRTDFTVADTWFSAGLRGSGSDDVTVDDAFVPEHRTLIMSTMREACSPGGAVHANTLYNQPFMSHGGHAMVSPAIGMARGVIDAWQEHVRDKSHSYTQEQVSASLPMQLTLAEAAVQVDAAELLLRRALARVDAGETMTLEDRVQHRRDITYGPQLLVKAVNGLMQMAGASGLRDDSPIQRGWRDIRAVSCHVFCNFNAAGENYGRMQFGFPLNPRDANF
jgi:3-hydroxy-9,10-secoandrosta-1,3,5(10)-triene-9,17-dione monooxygenase